ncbi:Regulator of RNase E activity RraA [Mucilaginibacter lappiensis]|uniref:Putative 4-hydroxy-4-methyl-2-oxoglutarate aldolase n=1 Tax=Mucilaginibacter lappiensis TaxID=354630 RepID=A0ABR6PCX1_9SPHI|nr:RraA family protein [Mucilaginibacter lappiensis]MBB6107556.1 regulator of RNase E activity RraA [Mucilaginibacter lappiensis]SIQ04496.1 Regulator of RNase E activity RraA [Mucilaginibacter lappiensis]
MTNNNNSEILWSGDDELFQLIRAEIYTAVVGDIMDKMGFLHQFLPPQIKPLRQDMYIVGRAMTVLEADVVSEKSEHNPILNKPFGLMLEALDDLKKNEVYICGGASPTYALWGELMSTRAIKLGAAGAIVDGYSRDSKEILELNFPTFSYGNYAQDQATRGKVIDFRVPIKINGVKINSGDVVLGDIDGVCIVPREIEQVVFKLAIEKARGEKMVRKKIEEGMSAKEAFEKYGIL